MPVGAKYAVVAAGHFTDDFGRVTTMKHTLLREINQDMASRPALRSVQALALDPARIQGGNWQMQYEGWIESTQVAEAATQRAAQNATGRDAALAALGVAVCRLHTVLTLANSPRRTTCSYHETNIAEGNQSGYGVALGTSHCQCCGPGT